jgi:pilus assembly protein CpaB
MQGRTPILIALGFAAVAVLLTNAYVNEVRRAARPDTTLVAVAARELRPGAVLTGDDIAPAERATAALPKLAIRWDERNLYLGQEIGFQVAEGDYLLASYFGGQAAAAQRLSEKIDAATNQRAMTIPVDNLNSIEGSIRPGDRIDLLLTYQQIETAERGPAGRPRLYTVPLLENMYVLFTGTYGAPPGGERGFSSLTLLVDSDQAKLLVWAMNLGKLTVLLRNPRDLQPTDRAYLAGGQELLEGLGRHSIRPSDLVSAPGAGVRQSQP